MPVPVIAERVDSYPLAPLQHGMLFHHLVEGPHAGFEVQQLDVMLREGVDTAALIRAWEIVAARHPVLRTRFRWEGLDDPRQDVMATIDLPLARLDLSGPSPSERSAAIDQFLVTDRVRGFDPGRAPLWRVTLVTVGGSRLRMVWSYSSAILDGSAADVIRELVDSYHALTTGIVPRVESRPSYRDHVEWLHEDWSSRSAAARAFWRERLHGFSKPTTLAAAHGTAAFSPLSSGSRPLRFRLSSLTAAALRTLCEADGLSLTGCVHAAWAVVLSAFTGEDDVVFGEVRTCRPPSGSGASGVIGQLRNILPVRARVTSERSVGAFLRDFGDAQAAVRVFEHTPLAEAAAASGLPRGAALFDTLVIVDDQDHAARFQSLRPLAEQFSLHERMHAGSTVRAVLEPRIAFELSFDGRCFDERFAWRVATLLKRVLHAMATRPAAMVGELPRLPAQDGRDLAAFNRTSVPIASACVHEAVQSQVDRTPDAVAVVYRSSSLTYRELDQCANRVAAELVGRGVGPDRTVGIYVDRSLEMIVGLLGILKAGGAYVPLDPSYPPERLALMIQDSSPAVLLTVDRLRAALPAVAAPVVTLDAIGRQRMAERVPASVGPEHLAYVIFTSGSTGRPKGVEVEHRNVINCFGGMDRVLGEGPGVWLAVSGISFDISVLELFWPLSRGFTVVIQDVAERAAAEASSGVRSAAVRPFYDFALRAEVDRHHVTHLQCTPSLLERFAVEEGGIEALAGLRHLLVGGEPLPAPLVDLIRPRMHGTLHNLYGPAETTIWSTTAVVSDAHAITIGRPMANVTIHIRDRTLRPMPVGAAGELLIGGAGVARGYAGRPELTGQRFVHDPETGERLYRTGDLAAWRPDGQLAFLGRMDDQVKIRGHRVELDDIDSVLGEHPSVRHCVTIAQQGPSGSVRLVAHVIPREAEAVLPDAARSPVRQADRVGEADADLVAALRQFAQRRLPPFMVPSAFVLLNRLPITPNGKVDRRALASRSPSRPTAGPRLPENEREHAILAVMGELVGRDVGVDDNFIDAGAHSLLLLRASGRLAARLGRRVTVTDLLRHPTARGLAAALAGADADAAAFEQSQNRARQRQDAIRRRRPGSEPA